MFLAKLSLDCLKPYFHRSWYTEREMSVNQTKSESFSRSERERKGQNNDATVGSVCWSVGVFIAGMSGEINKRGKKQNKKKSSNL